MADRIQASTGNPYYWEYRGEPTLLVGAPLPEAPAHVEDVPGLLALVEECGANFARCTLPCSIDPLQSPFVVKDGVAQLDQFDDAYFDRISLFLELTNARGIVVQLEIWDFDCFRGERWFRNPWNPTVASRALHGLGTEAPPGKLPTGFFRSLPQLDAWPEMLALQETFFNKVLDRALPFDHVLYSVSSVSSADPQWSSYWCDIIRSRATAMGRNVETTESFSAWDVAGGAVPEAQKNPEGESPAGPRECIDRPIRYAFVEACGIGRQEGRVLYDSAMWLRRKIRNSGRVRPLNCVRVGALDSDRHEAVTNTLLRMWRAVFAGVAAVHLDLPDPLAELKNPTIQSNIAALNKLTSELDLAVSEPRQDLIQAIDGVEAYCFGNPASSIAVLIIGGGSVNLDCESMDCSATRYELDVSEGEWKEPVVMQAGGFMRLTASPLMGVILLRAED